jgi:hypothetical protein
MFCCEPYECPAELVVIQNWPLSSHLWVLILNNILWPLASSLPCWHPLLSYHASVTQLHHFLSLQGPSALQRVGHLSWLFLPQVIKGDIRCATLSIHPLISDRRFDQVKLTEPRRKTQLEQALIAFRKRSLILWIKVVKRECTNH